MVFKCTGCQPSTPNLLFRACFLFKFSDFIVYESQERNKYIIASGGMRCAQVAGQKEGLGVS